MLINFLCFCVQYNKKEEIRMSINMSLHQPRVLHGLSCTRPNTKILLKVKPKPDKEIFLNPKHLKSSPSKSDPTRRRTPHQHSSLTLQRMKINHFLNLIILKICLFNIVKKVLRYVFRNNLKKKKCKITSQCLHFQHLEQNKNFLREILL